MKAASWIGVLFLLAAGGCAPLVGGACDEGFVADGERCVPVHDADPSSGGGGQGGEDLSLLGGGSSSSSGSSSGSGAGGGGPGCQPPLVGCGGVCVDLQQDFSHCGACGVHCATELCVEGTCVGEPVGHTIVIGMSYLHSTASSRKMLGNAVFRTLHQPLRILSVRHSASTAVDPVAAIVNSQAAWRGRSYSATTIDHPDLEQALASASYDVVLIEDMAAVSPGALEEIGFSHAQPLATFTSDGGTVVALATGQSCTYVDAAGLLPCTEVAEVTGKTVHNAQATDTVGNGVVSPFLARPQTVSFATSLEPSAEVVWVFTDAVGNPVVVHQVTP